ncbi:hypothetical protein CHS0354_018517 [Potamilus streckersoni]|uniref:Uncharacterized protein n=1 Tax=Potamilus streckersoni TaxID=2493646 RepID=A0AAE0TAR6_9BIVA|nr:hypothetical protein CHS0354_018517 [Potamilus streckersoni]
MFGKGDGSYFFLQQENGAFNVEEGSAISTGYESAQGIGMKFLMPLDGYNVYFVPVIGTSSVRVNNYNYSSDSTSDYVKGVEHTGPFSQIGFLYEYAENNVFASFGLSYRVLTLGNPIELKGSDAAATDRSKRYKPAMDTLTSETEAYINTRRLKYARAVHRLTRQIMLTTEEEQIADMVLRRAEAVERMLAYEQKISLHINRLNAQFSAGFPKRISTAPVFGGRIRRKSVG